MKIITKQGYKNIMKSLNRRGLVKVWKENERMVQITERGIKEIERFHNDNREFFVLLSIYFYKESIQETF